MASLRIHFAVSLCLFSTLCCAQDILAEVRKITEAIKNQKTEILSNFKVMKTELKNEVQDMLEGAKTEWEALNTRTRNDLAALQTLLDTDECLDLTHNCSSDALCTDTRTSFSCKCKPGFTGDGYTCEDIDECRDRHRCGHRATCKNTPGKYSCTCNPGFWGDGRDCHDIDECALGTHNCHRYAVCKNTVGSYTCHCTLNHEGDGIDCRAICRHGWEFFRNSCYFFSDKRGTWEEGETDCNNMAKDMNSGYAKITTDGEFNFVAGRIKGTSWIGLNDRTSEGNFIWADGSVTTIPSSWWHDGEPNNDNNQHCVDFWVIRGVILLDDNQCWKSLSYVCEYKK